MTGSGVERLAGIDAVRGVAIAFVVLIHATYGLPAGAYVSYVEQGVARLGVPLFLLISGALAGIRQTPRERFRRYFLTFLRLHLLYGVLYIPFALAKHGLVSDVSLKWLLLRFGVASWPGQYYFVILIQVFAVAAWVVPPRLWRRNAALGACAALVLLEFALLYGLAARVHSQGGPVTSLLLSKVHVGYWLYYFALGAWLGDRMRRDAAWEPPPVVVLLLLAAALAIVAFGLPIPGDAAELSYRRPRIYVATTLVALTLPTLAKLDAPAWLQQLGRESFGLYVLNPALLLALFTLLGEPRTGAVSFAYAVAVLAIATPLARQLRERAPWAHP